MQLTDGLHRGGAARAAIAALRDLQFQHAALAAQRQPRQRQRLHIPSDEQLGGLFQLDFRRAVEPVFLRALAQAFQLPRGALVQPPVFTGDFTRDGQAVLPACLCGRVGVVRVRHSLPANQQAAAVRMEGLRRVEIEAVIQRHERTQRARPPEVALQREIAAGVYIFKSRAAPRRALRRQQQEPAPVQLEQVGALPHIAERLSCLNGIDMLPVQPVFRLKHQQRPGIILHPRALYHIISAVLLPNLGVAHVAGHARRVILIFHQQPFPAQRHAVRRIRQHRIMPAPGSDIIVAAHIFHIPGVV